MNRTDKMIKRCRALALAGVLGLASLGNAVPVLAAGPGDDASRVTEISAGGPGDPGNKTSSNSTPNTNNSNNNNNTNNNIIPIIQTLPPVTLLQMPMPGRK